MGYTVLSNGLTTTAVENGKYDALGNVRINSGDPIAITVNYTGRQMMLSFTDAVAHTSFTTNFTVNVAGLWASMRHM
jgi:hypothetical protein